MARRMQPSLQPTRPAQVAGLALLLLALAGCTEDDESPGPGQPLDVVTLTVAVVSPTEVALSWTDPSTVYAQRPLDLYSEVERDGLTVVTTHEFAFRDSGVAPETRYCYRVLVVGIYRDFFSGSTYSYPWASGQTCVVTPAP